MTSTIKPLCISSTVEVVECAIHEIANTALSCDCVGPIRRNAQISPGLVAAYVPLISDSWTMGLAIASNRQGRVKLASALMMMDDLDHEFSEEDLADAIGEIANLLAGNVKKQLWDRNNDVVLGTPVIVRGKIEAVDRQQPAVLGFKIGDAEIEIVVILAPCKR